jgi:hypothetical protein
MDGVTHEDDIAVVPSLTNDRRELEPAGVVAEKAESVEMGAKDLLASL